MSGRDMIGAAASKAAEDAMFAARGISQDRINAVYDLVVECGAYIREWDTPERVLELMLDRKACTEFRQHVAGFIRLFDAAIAEGFDLAVLREQRARMAGILKDLPRG